MSEQKNPRPARPADGSVGKASGSRPGNRGRGRRPAVSGLSLAVSLALAGAVGSAVPQVASAQDYPYREGPVYWTGGSSDWRSPGNWYYHNRPFQGVPGVPGQPLDQRFGVNPIIDTPGPFAPVISGHQVGGHANFSIHTLIVGELRTGSLTIRDGGSLIAEQAVNLGDGAGSSGGILVTGEGSRLESQSWIYVGGAGRGELTVEDGAVATTGTGHMLIGRYDDGSGLVTVASGGQLTTGHIYAGFGNRARGELLVTGGGTVDTSGSVFLGYFGANYNGYEGGSSGHVAVTGAGSALRVGLDLVLGPRLDTAGELRVADGGLVEVTGHSQIAAASGTLGTVLVTGAGSQWHTGRTLLVGNAGGQASVTIADGALATSAQGDIGTVGATHLNDASRGAVTVTGAGSEWRNAGDVRIGISGGQGRLEVFDGGVVSSLNGYVGYNTDSAMNEAVVSGAGSAWIVGERLRVAQIGSQGRLLVSDGGRVSAAAADIGHEGFGAVAVTGAGSLLEVAGDLALHGFRGDGELTVADGGRVTSGIARIGTGTGGGSYGIATVTGAGSLWEADAFVIGNSTSTTSRGALIVSDGGRIAAESVSISGVPQLTGLGMLAVGAGLDADGNPLAAGGAGTLDVATVDFQQAPATLLFNHTDGGHVFGAALTGAAGTVRAAAGTTILTGDSAEFGGATTVTGGTLLVDGALGGGIAVQAGTFGGSGNAGHVVVADGATLSPGGTAIGTLSVDSLVLSDASLLRFDVGAPGVVGGGGNDLVEVAGNLTLDGLLHLDAAPEFGNGVYRLFNYGGALTDNGLDFASIVGGDLDDAEFGIQTAIGGQVNLVVGGIADPILFWQGGSGTWDADSENWTNADGSASSDWSGRFAVFQGGGGTVTVQGEQRITGLQFAGDGYTVAPGAGGALAFVEPETVIRVDPGNTATLSVALTGDGALVKRDDGTLVLSGTNGFGGGVVLHGGVLAAASDAALGAPAGAVGFRGGTLRVGDGFSSARGFAVGGEGGHFETGAGNATYAGLLTGDGAFSRVGTGTFEFAGDGSGYAGVFGAGGGRFHLSGELGGTLDVPAGTILSGTGTANDLRIAGRLAPGDSIGTLSASGDVVFLPGSTFEVEVAAGGGSDLLDVGGTVVVQGGTVEVAALDPQTAYADGSRYVFLRAGGGVEGAFDRLVENSAFLDFTLGYTADSAYLDLATVATFPDVAQTFNQVQASGGLGSLEQSGDALSVYNALLMLDADAARAAFDAASGEIHAGNQQVLNTAAVRFNRSLLRQGGAGAAQGLWVAALGASGKIDADGNAAALDWSSRGFAFGAGGGGETAGGAWWAGAAAAATETDTDADARRSRARGDAWHLGAYGGWTSGAWRLTGALGYMDGESDIHRGIAFGDLARTAASKQSVTSVGFSGEALWNVLDGEVRVAPLLTLDASRSRFGGLRESGAEALDLALEHQRQESLDVGLGVSLSGDLGAGGGYEVRALYEQDLAGDRTADRGVRLAGSPAGFVVRGPEQDRDRFRIAAGVDYPVSERVALGARYEGTFAGSGNAHGGYLRLDWRF